MSTRERGDGQALHLEPHHREMFERLRIPEELLRRADVRSVTHCEAAQLVGDFHKFDLTGLAFPYYRPGETRPHSHRVRRDIVRGEDPKYIAPPGHRALYFPPMSDALLHDVTAAVIFPESEKAALALIALAERIQRRWLAVALGGCWGWCAKTGIETAADGLHFPTTGPHPDFDKMALRDRDAIIVFDSNATSNPKVRKAEREFARMLQERGARLRIARIPQSQGVNGPDDYLSSFGGEAMVRIIDSATAHGAPQDAPERLAKLECFAQIQPKPLRWVWPERIPAGKLSLLVGDPDKGKSLITLDMAARITTGRPFPDGAPAESGSVIILSAEDDAEDTIRPRLEAASADLSRVHWLEAVRVVQRDGKQGERTFSLEVDVAALYDAIKQHPDVRLIIIDPISAYLGGTESHKNSEVRGLLAPLKEFTARTGVTVIGITHFRKSSGPAIHRSIDSIAFAAAARAVWGVAEHPDDAGKRVMLRIKGNLSRDPGGLAYLIEQSPSGIPHIAWEQGSVTLRADDVLGGLDSREDSSERHEAAQWLKSFLAGGPKLVREVKKQAAEARFSWATVRRAQVILGICKTKSGFQGSWEWSLPQPTSPKDAQPQHAEVSTFGENLINKRENASQPPKGAQPAQVSNLGREGSSFAPPSKGDPVATPKPVGVDKKWRF